MVVVQGHNNLNNRESPTNSYPRYIISLLDGFRPQSLFFADAQVERSLGEHKIKYEEYACNYERRLATGSCPFYRREISFWTKLTQQLPATYMVRILPRRVPSIHDVARGKDEQTVSVNVCTAVNGRKKTNIKISCKKFNFFSFRFVAKTIIYAK